MLSRKRRTASLLSSFSSIIEYPSPVESITSSGFTPVNLVLRYSRIESLSFFVRRKKAGNKRKTVVKEVTRDGNYDLLVYVLFYLSHCV